MKILEDIQNFEDLISRAQIAKEKLKDLKINWLTDPNKMQFKQLYSGDPTNGTTFKEIGSIKLNSSDKVDMFQSGDDNLRYTQLIELIDKGEPIIPPMYIERIDIVDGIEKIKDFCMGDGLHRTNLSRHLGLTEIPIVITKQIEKCVFTPHKWKFEAVEYREGENRRKLLRCSNGLITINILPETGQPRLGLDNADMINIHCWGCRVEVL
jgi:hypothetical protein